MQDAFNMSLLQHNFGKKTKLQIIRSLFLLGYVPQASCLTTGKPVWRAMR